METTDNNINELKRNHPDHYEGDVLPPAKKQKREQGEAVTTITHNHSNVLENSTHNDDEVMNIETSETVSSLISNDTTASPHNSVYQQPLESSSAIQHEEEKIITTTTNEIPQIKEIVTQVRDIPQQPILQLPQRQQVVIPTEQAEIIITTQTEPDMEIEAEKIPTETAEKVVETTTEEKVIETEAEKKIETEEVKKSQETKAEERKVVVPRAADQIINSNYLTSMAPSLAKVTTDYRAETPVKYVELPDFLPEDVLAEIQESLNLEDWFQQRMDAYSYEKTGDLKNTGQFALKELGVNLYSSAFRDFVSAVTGITAAATIDFSGDIFKQSSHYVCHRPERANQRIAFFLFLGPDEWTVEDGGTLDLFETGVDGQPTNICHSIVPKLNTLVLFEVTPNTFFQISEVFAKDSELVMISGYFRSRSRAKALSFISRVPKEEAKDITKSSKKKKEEFKLVDWLSPQYLEDDGNQKLKLYFERQNYLGLDEFLKTEIYDELQNALIQENIQWQQMGPPNIRLYGSLGRGKSVEVPGIITKFKQFLRSTTFCTFIKAVTGRNVWSVYKGEVRRFRVGDYSLQADHQKLYEVEGLDLHFCFPGESKWADEDGGFTTYMDNDDELLALIPAKNTLSLVMREQQCSRYVNCVTSTAPGTRYDFINTYNLASKEDDEGDDYKIGGGDEDDDDFDEDGDFEESEVPLRKNSKNKNNKNKKKTMKRVKKNDDEDDDEDIGEGYGDYY